MYQGSQKNIRFQVDLSSNILVFSLRPGIIPRCAVDACGKLQSGSNRLFVGLVINDGGTHGVRHSDYVVGLKNLVFLMYMYQVEAGVIVREM